MVIGGSISALLYSFMHGYPCICVDRTPPFRFKFDDELARNKILQVETGNLREIWERLIMILSLGGQLPMGDKTYSINIQDDNLKAFTSGAKLGRFKFNKLIIFDDKSVFGLPEIKKRDIGKSTVLDWYNVRTGMEHPHNFFETADDFVKEVYFYPSDRFGNQKSGRNRKDLVSVSYLSEDQIKAFDFSDTMAKFKILKLMKENGIRGARNGRDMNNPNIYRYYSPKIEAVERQIIPNIKNYYQQDKRFEFRYDTPGEILESFKFNTNTYSFKISEFLIDK
jgi:hypothetical protein